MSGKRCIEIGSYRLDQGSGAGDSFERNMCVAPATIRIALVAERQVTPANRAERMGTDSKQPRQPEE